MKMSKPDCADLLCFVNMADVECVETNEDANLQNVQSAVKDIDDIVQEKIEIEENKDNTYDKIASKLLKNNFILTALEFHTELVESGRELPRLRDYFSNPGNFEKHIQEIDSSPVLPRTSSIQTFDSLDFTPYSDDGDRQVDERVAVLEFELRKAKETIKALRTNLTVAAESNPNTPTTDLSRPIAQESVKPHEKRALNFLVNEYLLYHAYKLTSITFSDENEDQDFEDWDDVGLNIPKPPNLLQLYRNYSRQMYLHNDVTSKEVQTESTDDISEKDNEMCLKPVCEQEKKKLLEQVSKLALEKDEMEKTLDEQELQIFSLKQELNLSKHKLVGNHLGEDSKVTSTVENELDSSAAQEFVAVNNALNVEIAHVSEEAVVDSKTYDHSESFEVPPTSCPVLKTERNTPAVFQNTLYNMCMSQKIVDDSRLIDEVTGVSSTDSVVMMLARCLPHIVPNILLNKREELIPLILCAIALHPDSKQRDKLLNILFNLIKKPDEEQRKMILTGLVAIAQHLGPARVEAELLPQCWEQITHRYVERRLLVAESCGVLAPYVVSGIRSSLLLSMMQQMLQEDKDEMVRETVVRNLSLLLLYVDDADKFLKACGLLFSSLDDRNTNVVECGLNFLLPSVAVWAVELDLLESHLLPSVMSILDNHFKSLSEMPLPSVSGPLQSEEQRCILLVRVVSALLPFLFISVVKSGPFVEHFADDLSSLQDGQVNVDRIPSYSCVLHQPSVIYGNSDELLNIVKAFDKYISSEWYKPWNKHSWVVNEMLPWFHRIYSLLNSQRQAVIHSLVEMMQNFCHLFGRSFTQKNIKPLFLSHLTITEEEKSSGISSSRAAYQDATIPVYVAGVLGALHQAEDRQELAEFLQSLLSTISVYHLPDYCIKTAIVELCSNKAYHELLLTVLWDGVVHNSSYVRVTAGRLFEVLVGVVNENLLRTRVTPALVTLASDPEIVVRIATVPALGAIMELSSQKDLLEKVHLQLQTFLDDPMYWDQHLLHVEVIRTFAKVGPNTEPKFRDEFVLPRLAALAAKNNSTTNETKKMDIALALLEAFTAMSCCFMSDQLINEAFLPGLRCLRNDIQQIAHEYEDAVNNMIHEFEAKLDLGRSIESRPTSLSIPSTGSMEDMRNRMSKIFSARPSAPKPNIQNLFQIRKGK